MKHSLPLIPAQVRYHIMYLRNYYNILFMLISLTACQVITWQAVPPQISQTAIANDGSGTAVVMQNHEINKVAQEDPSNIFGASRHFEHQIFVQNQDGTERRAVTGKRPYRDEAGTLHYLKTAGYLLLGSAIFRNGQQSVQYEKIDLHTGHATLIRYHTDTPQHLLCKDLSPQSFVVENVLPSPTGDIIAYFYSPSCFKTTVEFLDAQTLTVIDTQQIEIKGINEAIWRQSDSGLIIYSTTESEGNNAWKLISKTPPVSISYQNVKG